MANIYWRKRVQANIQQIDMAKELGIPYEQYREIELGVRDMPRNLIDLFHKKVKEAEENPNIVKLEKTQKEVEYDEWIAKLLENNRSYLRKLMANYNILDYGCLGVLLGGYSKNTIAMYFAYPEKMNYAFKAKLYDFFHNELNIQLKRTNYKSKEKPRKYKKVGKCHISKKQKEIINEYLKRNKKSRVDLCNELGINQSTMAGYWTKERLISKDLLDKIMNYVGTPFIEATAYEPYEKIPPYETVELVKLKEDEQMDQCEVKKQEEITEEIIFAKKRELIELEEKYQKQEELKKYKKISEDGAEKIAIYRNALIESGIPADLADKMILTAVNASNGNSSFDELPF